MKIKTFILTFLLMMMSSPIVFGQSRASVTTDVSNWEGLKEALTVFNTGQDESEITVRLTADINIPADEAPIEIKAGKNVTLNLNGYVIKAASTKYVFNNLGNLTIRDGGNENSAIEGRGIFNGRTTGDGQFINRDAKLTIENGIFRSTSTDGGAAIHNYGIADIQGGSFYAEYAAIANFGEMTINNARIIGENYAINNDSTLTIGNTYYYGTIDTGDLTAEVNPAVYTVSPEGSVKPFEAYLYVKDFYYNTSEDYYKTVAEAVSKINSYKDTPKEATLTLLVNTEISNQILISNNATVNLNNKKVTFKGGDQSRFKVTADVTFKNGTIEGPERCVYTFSDGKDIALNLENVNLTTTGTTGYQQPLTIAGNATAKTTTVDLKNVKIDAGTATGYGIISFVKTMLTADEDTEVSGYAALYAKDSSAGATGSAGSEFIFNGSTLIGNGGKEGESNSFSTIALQESNVTVKMNGGVAKSLGGNHAILGIGWTGDPIETGNTIVLDAEMEVTGGSQYLYMKNANTNTVVVRSEYVDDSWSTAAYGDLVQVKGIAVAKIGDVKYCSLAEAVEAATADATIELLNADVDESAATVTINKKLNLKGEGIDKYKFPQIKLEGTANVSVAGTSYHPTTFEYFNVTVGELAQFIVKGYSTVNGTFVNDGSITLNTATIGGNITNNKNIVVKNASDIIASEYSGNGTINLENVRMSATKLSGVGSVVATGTNDIVASTISARSFKVENEAVVNLNDNAYVNGISNGSTMTVNGTLNVTNSAVWYLNVNLAEASKLKVTGKHTINNTSIKNKEFIVNTQMNVANGAEIFVASDAVLTAKKAVVAEDAVVALNFYANVTFTETVNNGTINLYLNEGKTFTTPEITEGLNVETEYGCIVSYEDDAYEAIRILNEGDVAVIAETGIGYETLQDAINAVQDGQVIKLIKNIDYIDYVYASGKTTAVNIANNKQFTLDLNGYTIYGENSTTGNYELITIAQGTQLTIDDLSADKKGKISYKGTRTTADGWMRRCHTIFNQGSLIVNNGLIENITPAAAEAVASAIDNNASWGKLGHLTINGGTVKSTSYYAVRTDVNTHNTSAATNNVAKTVFDGGEVYGFYLMDRGSDIYNNTQNPNNIDVDITENATIKPCEYNGQALRFVFNNKSPYDVEISEEAEIDGTIKGIDAKIGNKYYPLQGAIDAVPAVADAETTIEFIHDITSDATVSQAENKNIIIDGKEFKYSGTIYIEGNSRYTGAETLTIQNVNFTTEKDSHNFIASDFRLTDDTSDDSVIRYAHKVTVKDCDFTSTYTGDEKNEVVAMKFRQAYDINVIGGEFTNLHSVMQANGNTNVDIEGITANCAEGIFSITGGAGSFSIKDSEFTSEGYGIRVGEGNKNFNIEGCTITAPVPVAVRYAENGGPLYFTFGQNTMNSDNPYNYWFVAGTGKDEYDGGETLPEIGGQVVVNIDEDSDLDYEGVYGNYYVVKIEDTQYPSLAAALAAVENGQTIVIVRPNVGKEAAINYPAADATDYATEFTITGGEGYQFSGITFRGDVNVTLDNATLATSLYALEDANITFVGNNKVNAILGTKDEKVHFNVADGALLDMTYGKLWGNVNMYGNSNISFAEVGDAAYGNNIYMYGVTLAETTAINGANVLFVEGENTLNGATIKANDFDVNQGVTVNVEGNSSIKSSLTEGFSDINGTLNVVNAEEVYFTRLNISSEGSIVNANTNSTMVIGTISNETTGKIKLAKEVVVRHADGGNSIRHFVAQDWDYEVYYDNGYYKVREIEFNFCINNEHERSYLTFEEALANVADGDTIYITTDAQGNEASTIFTYDNAIEFTVTGDAQEYVIPRVTFENATVNIDNAKFSSPDIDARHNAVINIVDSEIHNDITQDGKNPTVKATSNGIINIDNSVISTCNLFAMGELNIKNNSNVYATANTSVFETGKLNITAGAEVHIAPLALTGQVYEGTFTGAEPANPDDVTPARLTVDGATLIVGKIIDIDGGDYSYHTETYGIKVGTDADRTAFLDIKNGATVKFYMDPTTNKTYKQPLIGEKGTINIEGSSFEVISRKEGETLALQNNGTINVTGESFIDVRKIEGNAINMTNATLADSYVGGAINTFGTNNIVGTSNVTGLLSVGYNGTHETPAVLNITGNFNGTNVVVGSAAGHKLNVGAAAQMENNLITNRTTAYFGQLGGHGDINIENTDVTYHYTFIRKNFNLNNSIMTNTSVNTYISGNAVVNVTDSEWTVGEYSNIGSYGGYMWGNADVTLTRSKMIAKNNLGVEKSSTYNVKLTLVDSELQVKAFTNQGTVELKGNSTVTTDTFNNSGSITIGQGTQMTANKNIGNSGTMTVDGTLVADKELNTTGTVAVAGTLKHSAPSVENTINVNGGTMAISGTMDVYNVVNNVNGDKFQVTNNGKLDVVNFTNNGIVNVTNPTYIFVANAVTGENMYRYFNMTNVALNGSSTLKGANIKFAGNNTLDRANLTDSKVTVNSGAKLQVISDSYYLNEINVASLQNNGIVEVAAYEKLTVTGDVNSNELTVNGTLTAASLTNNGTLTVGNYANVNVTNTVSNKATATVNGTLTAATLNNNSYSTLTVNGSLTATTELYNAANATINGSGNIKADASTITDLTNNGVIEGDLTISAKTINNYNKIDVAEIVATDFYNTNMTYSSVIVDDATLQSVSFTNSGTVNVTGESTVKITNEVSDSGQFVMEGVNLTSGNTNLHGAYIVFNGENSATNLTFSGRNDVLTGSGIQVNGTLNIYGEVTANRLGTGEGTVVLKETTSKLTANSGLKLYPEEDPFVITDVEGYHVVQGTDNIGLPNGVYTLKSNDAYVAMVNGNYYETIQGAIDAAEDGNTIEILKSTEQNVTVDRNVSFTAGAAVTVTGTLTVEAEKVVSFNNANVTFNSTRVGANVELNINNSTYNVTTLFTDGTYAVVNVDAESTLNVSEKIQFGYSNCTLNIGGTVTTNKFNVPTAHTIVLDHHDATLTTTNSALNVSTSLDADHKVSYKNGMYQLVGKYVAQIGDVKYETLADALVAVPSNGTIELLWEEGNDPIVMAGILTGKNATIKQAVSTDEIDVDWSKGWLFIARGAEYNNGPSKLTFEGVNLYSVNDGVGTDNNRYGINVSAKRKNTENYNGTLVIKDSYVELSYLYNAYEATFDNSTVTLVNANGMNVGGLLGAYTTTGQPGTATLNIENGTTFNVTNITIGYDGIGIMNVDATSVVKTEPQYGLNVIKDGYLNTYGNFDGYSQFNLVEDGIVNVYSGLYSFDVNVYCVEGVAAFELPDGYWEVRETHGTQTRELAEAGWYWFSSYISDLEGTTGLQLLQSELNPNGKQIKGQFAFTNYFGSKWSTGGLQSVTTAQMYMLNTTAPVTLDFEGEFVDYSNTPIVLNPGWNWIGFPVRYAQTVEVALANLQPKHGDIIKGKNGSSTYYVTDSFEGWFPELILEPGHGHMYFSNSDEQVTFVFNSNGQPAESKRATAAMYWNVNETAYPSNMTMIATTDIEGGDYEVAAFVNGEVRGSARPIYVEAMDAYVLVLTIQGNDVEEMTFRYYDIATGEEMSFSNRINYTNDAIIGSMAEPYKLTRGTTGIGEVALSDVNIYPNPTTTGVQVNLDATCEKVEIFNALGVKVAEYQNVDSIDAFETAGIYVIRLTNGGEIKHTRLVVR